MNTDFQMDLFFKITFSFFNPIKFLKFGFENYKEVDINFIGSVAYYLSDEIHTVAKKYNCKVNGIIKNPIDNLVSYHFKYSCIPSAKQSTASC